MPLCRSHLDRMVAMLAVSLAAAMALSALAAAAYLGKSALGIDLLDGRSPLHDLLYWIVA